MPRRKPEHTYSIKDFHKLEGNVRADLIQTGFVDGLAALFPGKVIMRGNKVVGAVHYSENKIKWMRALPDPAFLRIAKHTLGEELLFGVLKLTKEPKNYQVINFGQLKPPSTRALQRAKEGGKLSNFHEPSDIWDGSITVKKKFVKPFLKWQ